MTAARPAVAFDFDGTLVSCAPRQLAVLRAVLRQLDLAMVDAAEHWRLKRSGASTVAALRDQGLSERQATEVGRLWRNEVERLPWLALDAPFRGVRTMLEDLVRRGFDVVLLSARSSPAMLRLQVGQAGIGRFLAEVRPVAPGAVVEEKAAVLRAIEPIAYVGDTESDAQCAQLAGTPFLAVSSGQRSRDFLAARGVGPIYPDVVAAVTALLQQRREMES